jgi:hypothetical protein
VFDTLTLSKVCAEPTPVPTLTPSPTPTLVFTPAGWIYLPVMLKDWS